MLHLLRECGYPADRVAPFAAKQTGATRFLSALLGVDLQPKLLRIVNCVSQVAGHWQLVQSRELQRDVVRQVHASAGGLLDVHLVVITLDAHEHPHAVSLESSSPRGHDAVLPALGYRYR